jgi:hypothetical protein
MKMTLQQHRRFGEQIRRFRELLLEPQLFCIGTKSSPENRAVRNALSSIDHLKHRMDCVLFRDFPNCKDPNHVYYGASAQWIRRQERLASKVPAP